MTTVGKLPLSGKLTAGVVDTDGNIDFGKDVTAGVDNTNIVTLSL
jgi:hypothetical protein